MKTPKKMGRPPIDPRLRKDRMPLKLPRWLIDWLDQQSESRAKVIEDALIRRHKLSPPT